jgi:hypothetical protein
VFRERERRNRKISNSCIDIFLELVLIVQKQIIPNVNDLLTPEPNDVSEETKNERKDSDDDLYDNAPSHIGTS